MHPAPSVIVFTTLSGFGFGLMFWLGLGATNATGWGAFWWSLLAGASAAIGLLASTLHLGHPERALKAFSQWRSSWLSREGIVSIATLIAFAVYGALWMFFDIRLTILGWLAAALAALTVFCTAMIYAQLRTVPRWNTALTPLKFMLFSLALPALLVGLPTLALCYFIALLICQIVHWRRGDTAMRDRGHNAQTATGLGDIGTVRLLEAPHTAPNYLMREMVFKIGRERARVLRLIALIAGIALPAMIAALDIVALLPVPWLVLATVLSALGTFAARWLFFAEAQHVVSLYYDHSHGA